MNRLIVATLLAAGLGATATSASAAEHCRPRPGEHQLARSAQAVVLERTAKQSRHLPRQTIIGCSRASGKRRTIDTLQRQDPTDPTKLVGLRLAGTRIAYMSVLAPKDDTAHTTVIVDDAIHGGRRHDLGVRGWAAPRADVGSGAKTAWAVDAQGDVAWLVTEGSPAETLGAQSVGVWRPGLGRRQLDAHAVLSDLTLRDGVVRWRRNGTSRSASLAEVTPSRCPLKATTGTLDVDIAQDFHHDMLYACLRDTGLVVPRYMQVYDILDVNGPYIIAGWWQKAATYTWFADLRDGTMEDIRRFGPQSVVDDHGSIAWLYNGTDGGFWVRDAAGMRKVADTAPTAGPLLRDGSTVTVADGGPTMTLNP